MGSHSQSQPANDDLKRSKMERAQRELEEMYMGVPDESVNLTFQHLAHVRQQGHPVDQVVTPPISPAVAASGNSKPSPTNMSVSNTISKLPSLDFNRGMEASRPNQYHLQTHISSSPSGYNTRHSETTSCDYNMMMYNSGQYHNTINSPAPAPVSGSRMKLKQQDIHRPGGATYHLNDDDDMTTRRQYEVNATGTNKTKQFTMNSPVGSPRGVVTSRPGVPHSKICAVCDRHIYVFRHRCLVCGRVYCRNCVNVGMGEMSEGRKCVECLGRRFSQRYIQRAGKTEEWWRFCCWHQSSYPDKVRQQELKWAEKGPRITSRMTNTNNDLRSRRSIIMMPSSSTNNHNNYGNMQQQQPSPYHHDNPPSFVSSPSPSISSPYLHF